MAETDMTHEQITGPLFADFCRNVFVDCGSKWKLFYVDDFKDLSDVGRQKTRTLKENNFIFIAGVWIKGFDTLDEAMLALFKLPGGVQLADHSNEPWTLEARQ